MPDDPIIGIDPLPVIDVDVKATIDDASAKDQWLFDTASNEWLTPEVAQAKAEAGELVKADTLEPRSPMVYLKEFADAAALAQTNRVAAELGYFEWRAARPKPQEEE